MDPKYSVLLGGEEDKCGSEVERNDEKNGGVKVAVIVVPIVVVCASVVGLIVLYPKYVFFF